MNFYRRRPLAVAISFGIAVSAAAGLLLSGTAKLILIAVIIAAAVGMSLLFAYTGVDRILGMHARAFVLLAAVSAALTLLTSYAYFNVYAAGYETLSVGRVRAVVTEVESCSSYNAVYSVKLETLDGESANASGLIGSDTAVTLVVGDVIETDVAFCTLDEFYDYHTVSRAEMLADGYVFAGSTDGHVELVGSSNGIEVRISRLREQLGAKMGLYLDDDSAALADALLLGERGGLGRITRDFTYIGVLHILALSGLHIAVTSAGVDRLLSKLYLGRRARYVILTLILIFYTALTGLLMSVIRASVMMILTFAAGFIDQKADRITSLFAAVWLIMLASPASVYDVSLQLSFFAALGVLLLSEAAARIKSEREQKSKGSGRLIRRFDGFGMNIAASLGASIFVLPLQWLYFGEVSLMSVPATLIISLLCEGLLFILPCYLVCTLIGWHFMCGRLAWLISVLCEICSDAAKWLAERSELISLGYPFALPIIVCLAAAIIFMMVRNVRSWLWSLIPLGVAGAVFLGCVGIYDNVYKARVTLDYVNHTSNDGLLLVSEREAMLLDITDGSSRTMGMLREELAGRYLTEIDTMLLCDVEVRTVGEVRSLMEHRVVHRLLVPAAADESELYLLDSIHELAEEYGAEVIFYSPQTDNRLTFADVTVTLPAHSKLTRSTQPLIVIGFECDNAKTVYMSTATWEDEGLWEYVKDSDRLIFGANGPKFKAPPEGGIPEGVRAVVTYSQARLRELSLGDYEGEISCGERVHTLLRK